MRDIFFAIVLLAAIPIGLMHAHLAVIFWYWVSFLQPHTQSFSFAASLPFGQAAAGVTLLSWMMSKDKKLPPPTAIVVLLVLLAVWVSLTTLTAMFPQPAAAKWDVTVKTILMVFIGLALIQNREKLHLLIWAICIAVGFFGFKLGLFSLRGFGSGGNFRGPAYMADNNGLARGMLMTVPLLWYLFFQYKQTWLRAGVGTVAVCSMAALVFSSSRGGWMGAIAAMAFAGLHLRRGLLLMCIAGVVGLALIPLLPESIVARFYSIGDLDTDASFQGRVGAWRYGLELFAQRPIIGGGFGVFDYGYGKASHNSYFQMLGEHGAVGLLLFVALLVTCFMVCRRIMRGTKYRPDLAWAGNLAFTIQVTLVGYCVGSLTINHAVFPLLYAVVGILGSLQIIVQRELQPKPAAAPAAAPATLGIGPAGSAPILPQTLPRR